MTTALDIRRDALDAAVRAIIRKCGCQTLYGCCDESPSVSEDNKIRCNKVAGCLCAGAPGEPCDCLRKGCARFVAAVRGCAL